MNYKTLLGATEPASTQSYDSSGINPNPTNVDITNPADKVEVKPSGSEANVDTSGGDVVVDPTSGDKVLYPDTTTGKQSFVSPLILLGAIAFAFFITRKKK